MKASRFTDAQKAFVVKSGEDDTPVAGCYQAKSLRADGKRYLIDGILSDWQVSARRACAALRFDRTSYHYKPRRPDPSALKSRIKEICEARVRYGYRRVHYTLCREG